MGFIQIFIPYVMKFDPEDSNSFSLRMQISKIQNSRTMGSVYARASRFWGKNAYSVWASIEGVLAKAGNRYEIEGE